MVFGSTLEGARWAFPSYSNLMKLASFLGKPQMIEMIFEGKDDEKQHGEGGSS